MAVSTADQWNSLSRAVKEVFGWAKAIETGVDVGTRTLLIGLIRAAPGDNLAEDLLDHVGVPVSDLIEALAVARPPIDTEVGAPKVLTELPQLTPNAWACLRRAGELRSVAGTEELDERCLFGGVLSMSNGTAYRGLKQVLRGVTLKTVRENYVQWLGDQRTSYAEHLAHTLRVRRPRGGKRADGSAEPNGDDSLLTRSPWTRVALLRSSGSGPEDGGLGLGLVVEDRALVTAREIAAADHALGWLADTSVELTPISQVGSLVLHLALGAAPLGDERPALVIGEPVAGDRCTIAVAERLGIGLLPVVVEPGGSSEHFVVDPLSPPPRGSTSLGSPVVDSKGAVVGIVVGSAAERTLGVAGPSQIRRALELVATDAPARAVTGSLSGAGNDAVGDVDQLGFQAYVDAFADLITSRHTQPPLTIGIFGSWGMGKSFLLAHIEREIERRQAREADVLPRVHVVRFNAWEYSAAEVVWPGLVRKIVTRLDELETWPLRKRVWTRLRWNVTRQWRALRFQLLALVLVAAGLVTLLAVGRAAIAGAIAAVVGAAGLVGLLRAATAPVARWVTLLFAGSDYGQQPGVMEDIKHDLEMLERRLHATGAGGEDVVTGRILVLIDDLDRCEPAKAVEVLQAINLLLNFSSFVVCLGIDARVVTGAVERHYEGLLGEAGASGYEYLDKIVQIPFRIPEPGPDEVTAFVASQLGGPEREDGVQTVHGDTGGAPDPAGDDTPASAAPGPSGRDAPERSRPPARATPGPPAVDDAPSEEAVPFTPTEREAFERFSPYLRPNPRHLKRLVNVYRLVRALARSQHESLILERPAATIRWLVMWSQWPYTSRAMLARYDERLDEWGGSVPPDTPAGEPLLHLLNDVESSLDPVMRAALDDDPPRLRDLLALEDCTLSWEEIARIRRYTVNFNPAVEERAAARVRR